MKCNSSLDTGARIASIKLPTTEYSSGLVLVLMLVTACDYTSPTLFRSSSLVCIARNPQPCDAVLIWMVK